MDVSHQQPSYKNNILLTCIGISSNSKASSSCAVLSMALTGASCAIQKSMEHLGMFRGEQLKHKADCSCMM